MSLMVARMAWVIECVEVGERSFMVSMDQADESVCLTLADGSSYEDAQKICALLNRTKAGFTLYTKDLEMMDFL